MVAAPRPHVAPGWSHADRGPLPRESGTTGVDRERSWYVRFGKTRYLIIDTSPTPQHDTPQGSGPTTLADPGLFANGPPHELLTALRRSSPVVWQEMEGQNGFFAVLTHADIVHASRNPVLFSASEGGITLEDATPETLEMSRNMLVVMDPPRHVAYRRPLAPSFKAKLIAGLEDEIRVICRGIMGAAREGGPELDFIHDVAAPLPTRVMGRLMGLPEADWPFVHRLAERMLSSQDPDVDGAGDQASLFELAGYAMGFIADRRAADPRPDLTTVLLDEEFDGKRMTDADIASLFVQLVGAGNDTTKTMTSSGLLALLQHPAQLAELRASPGLIPGAVEEVLRWANPVHYMRRTTTDDTFLHGVPIGAGQKVALYYTSGNRDEAVFSESQRFDIHRSPNPHLAFGIAEHFCLGVHLARLEARVFFEELLAAFPTIELAGEPLRLQSNFNNAYRVLPVRLGG
jgi:cytochrome P450